MLREFGWCIVAFTTFVIASANADEPMWTDAERAKRSDVVFVGKVVRIQRAGNLNGGEDLFTATVLVQGVDKSPESKSESQLLVTYSRPQDGLAGKRCPAYVDLELGQTSRFFCRYRKVPETTDVDQNVGDPVGMFLWLEMGADVGPAGELSPIFSHALSAETDKSVISAAKQTGEMSALRDIEKGVLRILSYGRGQTGDKVVDDDETEFRVQVVGGCVVSQPFVAEVDAYNVIMRRHFHTLDRAG